MDTLSTQPAPFRPLQLSDFVLGGFQLREMVQDHLIEIVRTEIRLYVAVHTQPAPDIRLTRTLIDTPISPSLLDDIEQAIATAKNAIYNNTDETA